MIGEAVACATLLAVLLGPVLVVKWREIVDAWRDATRPPR